MTAPLNVYIISLMSKKVILKQGERPQEYKLYNLGEAANWLRMDPRILKSEINKGSIAAIKAGEQTYRISGENLLRYTGSQSIAQMKPDTNRTLDAAVIK